MANRQSTTICHLLMALSLLSCDKNSQSETHEKTWETYSIEPPTGTVLELLNESPLLYPTKECRPLERINADVPDDSVTMSDTGVEEVCVWENTTGHAPTGMSFTQVADCSKVFTQAPSWFVEPAQVFASDPSILEDEAYTTESSWVRDEVRGSGCACCHASSVGSGHTSGFDVDAPQVWTDSFQNYQLAMISGLYDEHRYFGILEPGENHGFSREDTMFPTTDPERMKTFFLSELERRNASQGDFDEAERVLKSFFSRLFEEPTECTAPWTGIENGKIIWNDEGGARQIYVLQDNTETPGFPPTEDTPTGTVWALYVNPDAEPIVSGQIEIGEIPPGSIQRIPADGSPPILENGKTYRLFTTPDFQLIRQLNCTFVYNNSTFQ